MLLISKILWTASEHHAVRIRMDLRQAYSLPIRGRWSRDAFQKMRCSARPITRTERARVVSPICWQRTSKAVILNRFDLELAPRGNYALSGTYALTSAAVDLYLLRARCAYAHLYSRIQLTSLWVARHG